MDLIEVLQYNFLDIFGQVVAGLVVLFIAGFFAFLRKNVFGSPTNPQEKVNTNKGNPAELPHEGSSEPAEKPAKQSKSLKRRLCFSFFYVLACALIGVAVFVIVGAAIDAETTVGIGFISEAFMALAIPVVLISLTVAFIIYTSGLKDVTIIATVVVAVVYILELSRGGDFDVLVGVIYSIFHIVFCITVGPMIGIAIKKLRDDSLKYIVGGVFSAIAYPLLLLVRVYFYL